MDDYEYEYKRIESLDTEELEKIIEDMWNYEEVTKALMVLQGRNRTKALKHGLDILINGKGDDYLQATVWDIFFYDNEKLLLEAISERKNPIGKTLLNDMMHYLVKFSVEVPDEIINKILKSYDLLSSEEKSNMFYDSNDFMKKYIKEHNS